MSVGGLTESLVRHSSSSLMEHLQDLGRESVVLVGLILLPSPPSQPPPSPRSKKKHTVEEVRAYVAELVSIFSEHSRNERLGPQVTRCLQYTAVLTLTLCVFCRVTVPLLKTFEVLISNGCLDELLDEGCVALQRARPRLDPS